MDAATIGDWVIGDWVICGQLAIWRLEIDLANCDLELQITDFKLSDLR
jgi:hypothetical protein